MTAETEIDMNPIARKIAVTVKGRVVGAVHALPSGPALNVYQGPFKEQIEKAYDQDHRLKNYLTYCVESQVPEIDIDLILRQINGAASTDIMVDEAVPANDPVNHPKHYTSHPSGIECIEVVRHMGFNLGNVVKYIWRDGLKDTEVELQDLKKALWYLQDEIAMREESGTK